MQDKAKLPVYSANQLAGLSPQELIDLMIADEDRVPRNVIDECAQRGEKMVEHLAALADNDSWRDEISTGEWWMLLHAVMILGLIQTDSAGQLLVKFMRRMSVEDDGDLQDWLAGYWPALFSNKPETTHPALLSLCEDREMDWYMRANAIEAYTATQHTKLGEDALARALERLAGIAADEQEEWDIRMLSGNYLLDFPRPQYRTLLDDMAAQQDGCWGVHFSQDDVEHAYATMQDNPVWKEGFKNPWKFYLPQQIAVRQEQWAQEAAKQAARQSARFYGDEDDEYPDITYVRESPKVGRNDPCPCGSGKKYKKCCLAK